VLCGRTCVCHRRFNGGGSAVAPVRPTPLLLSNHTHAIIQVQQLFPCVNKSTFSTHCSCFGGEKAWWTEDVLPPETPTGCLSLCLLLGGEVVGAAELTDCCRVHNLPFCRHRRHGPSRRWTINCYRYSLVQWIICPWLEGETPSLSGYLEDFLIENANVGKLSVLL
jgi:hypothetical protein